MDALQTRQSLLVIHSHWSDGSLKLWAESEAAIDDAPPSVEAHHAHPFAATPDELIRVLRGARAVGESATIEELELLLPAEPETRRPLASETLWARSGRGRAGEAEPVLERYRVGCVSIEAGAARRAINRLFEPGWAEEEPSFAAGPAVAFHAEVVALADHILAQHRVVPILTQRASGALHASWMPWAADDQTAGEVAKLVRAMPPVARAAIDGYSHQPWASLGEMLWQLVDESCRATLRREEMYDTVEGRSTEDPQVAWLHGLLGPSDEVDAPAAQRQEMIRRVRRWIGGLEERGASAEWRLCLRLTEPLAPLVAEEPEPGKARKAAKPTKELLWSVSFHLQAVETPELFVDAPDVWALPGDDVTIGGHRLVGPQELLLGELGRAAKYFKKLESALADPEPIEVELTTDEAYAFLRELRPVLVEQGFGVQTPTWWESPESRLGARLRLAPPSELGDADRGPEAVGRAVPRLGLSTLVDYHWEIAVGDTTLSLKEFEQIASQGSPLIRMGGRWVEVRPEDLEHAIKFIRENPGGQMKIGEAMGFAFGTAASEVGLPVLGIEAEGWLGSMLGADLGREALPVLEQPESFRGTLRPYQTRGMSWMSFMERFGFGVCLADDMGLGKTIQLLALLQSERADAEEETAAAGEGGVTGPMGPTLLVAPTSVLGNWMHESERFAPELSVLVHHGAERLQDDPFIERARRSDLVITTYALVHRDRELLGAVDWRRVVLDEAQCIKNPAAKQSQAVRSLPTDRRIALTGTPVENRLSELWSVMDFLNPGYLGDPGSFRKRFSIPIERHHDQARADRLRVMVRPFILRRLKTDPTVVSDLPEKLESKEYCHLTGEQAQLYENCVKRMLGEVERAEGIQRRGLVLSALIRLKQICNHPSQLLKDVEPGSGRPPAINRSGKSIRLCEQIEEVLAEGEQALIFTQFRQMGHLLHAMLRQQFERDVLFLHGGTPQKQRQSIVEAFQQADGKHPILILSLKAGGVGLNLTAATHVFHYDRWWNPAVENQATDRAYRIGQTRTVVVHKYLVRGTLEERIDQMIEQKTELAENIIGSGERWLTELSTDDLRDILTLRSNAIGDEA